MKLFLIVGGIVLLGFYARRRYLQSMANRGSSKEKLIAVYASKLEPETVEKLTLNDVADYFKSLQLRKDVHSPFVAVTVKDDVKSYVIATFDNEKEDVTNGKLIVTNNVDDDLLKVMGDETFVVLN